MFKTARFLLLALVLLIGSGQTPPDHERERLLQEAQVLFDSARYDLALQRSQTLLEQLPQGGVEAAECLLLLGNVFLEKGQWDAAKQQYQTALAIFLKKNGTKHRSTAQAYNRLGEYFYKKLDFVQAETYHRKCLQIRLAVLGDGDELVADAYNNIGNCQASLGNYAQAETLHQRALDIRQRALPAGHPDLATSFNNLGNCAYYAANYPAALAYFEKALLIRQKVYGLQHPKTAQVFNNLGNACAALGQRTRAVTYYKQALEVRERLFGNQHPLVASTLENIADVCFDNGDHIAALDFFRQAYNIQSALQGSQSSATASLWHKMGLCYQIEGDYDRAIQHHLTVAPILEAAFGRQHPFIGNLYNSLGNCFLGKKEFARAADYYGRAVKVFEQAQPVLHERAALVYNNLANTYLEQNQAQKALFFTQKSLASLQQAQADDWSAQAEYLKTKGLVLDCLDRWKEASAAFETGLMLAQKSEPIVVAGLLDDWAAVLCNRGLRNQDTAMVRQAIGYFAQARVCWDSLRMQLNTSGAQQHWLEQQLPAQASAVEAYYYLWEKTGENALLEHAFSLVERNKSLQLLEHLRKEQAERFAGIPDSLLEQERYWSETINRLEKIFLAYQHAGQMAEAQRAESAATEARQALISLITLFEREYPDYFRLKYDRSTASVPDIRAHLLQPDQALVEYFETDSALFVFVITQQDFRCLRLQPAVPLKNSVMSLRYSLQAYPDAADQLAAELSQSFVENAFAICQTAFAPLSKAVALPSKIIVVPDGALCYLPFECLLSERPADCRLFKYHHYLIRDYQFSYAYSASQQLALLQMKPPKNTSGLLAVAPTYAPNRFGLRPLQNNQPEGNAVATLFQGDLLAGPAATVSAFLSQASQYRILLLAMHGKASSTVGELSYLAFSTTADTTQNPFLYARDLYAQSIPADLVVLSACETSVGTYRPGQGVISLAKAFFHAGARSVAATLWSVDDAKNAELMQSFFKNIKNGAYKDAALHQAKLAFLQSHPQDEAHPVYWAAVTAYGDMQPIQTERNWWLWVALGGFLVVLLGFFIKKGGLRFR